MFTTVFRRFGRFGRLARERAFVGLATRNACPVLRSDLLHARWSTSDDRADSQCRKVVRRAQCPSRSSIALHNSAALLTSALRRRNLSQPL
jgi:hypothetical protein